MTYKAYLEQLLCVSIQTANELIDVVRKEGQNDSSHFLEAKEIWEAAEREYVACLQLLESGRIRPEDTVNSEELGSVQSSSCL